MSQLPALPPGARLGLPSRSGAKSLAITTRGVDALAHHLLPYHADAMEDPHLRARPMLRIGVAILALFVLVFGLFGGLVPLATGALATGRVISESRSKPIQHLEGGIVKDILVKEGEKVAAGAVLVRLENVPAQARNEVVRKQYVTAKATEARLLAERDGKSTMAVDASLQLQAQTNPALAEILESQQRLFTTRKAALEGQINVLQQKINQSGEEARGLREQASAAENQIALLQQEISVVEKLVADGNATRPRLLALQRQSAQLAGQKGQSLALASRAAQAAQEARMTMLNAKNEYLNTAIRELKDVQSQLGTLEEQQRASADVVRRVEITAPLAGTVTGLAVTTPGAVIPPGGALMTLVPAEDRLMVEARINPQDIDVVHEGLEAQVRLTAYKARNHPPLSGRVTTVSADRFDDPKSGESFYTARVEITPESLANLPEITLTPGMVAEVLIVTGERTMLSYLLQPLSDAMRRAFRD